MTSIRVALAGFVLILGLGVFGWAQVPAPPNPPGAITGPDLAFWVERAEGNTAVGKLMVRLNGKWLEAKVSGSGGLVPLHSK
jgi:hypothetical protein